MREDRHVLVGEKKIDGMYCFFNSIKGNVTSSYIFESRCNDCYSWHLRLDMLTKMLRVSVNGFYPKLRKYILEFVSFVSEYQ